MILHANILNRIIHGKRSFDEGGGNMSILHHYYDEEDEEVELSWDEMVSKFWEESLSMNEARARIYEYEFGDGKRYDDE